MISIYVEGKGNLWKLHIPKIVYLHITFLYAYRTGNELSHPHGEYSQLCAFDAGSQWVLILCQYS